MASTEPEILDNDDVTESVSASPLAVTVSITPLLVNIHQARAVLGDISERQIRAWVASGKFPRPIDLGARLTRWRLSDIVDWTARLPSRR